MVRVVLYGGSTCLDLRNQLLALDLQLELAFLNLNRFDLTFAQAGLSWPSIQVDSSRTLTIVSLFWPLLKTVRLDLLLEMTPIHLHSWLEPPWPLSRINRLSLHAKMARLNLQPVTTRLANRSGNARVVLWLDTTRLTFWIEMTYLNVLTYCGPTQLLVWCGKKSTLSHYKKNCYYWRSNSSVMIKIRR